MKDGSLRSFLSKGCFESIDDTPFVPFLPIKMLTTQPQRLPPSKLPEKEPLDKKIHTTRWAPPTSYKYRLITPLIGVITPVTHLWDHIQVILVVTPLRSSRGPPCVETIILQGVCDLYEPLKSESWRLDPNVYFVYLVYLRFVGISFDSYHYFCLIFINLGMCIYIYIHIYLYILQEDVLWAWL